VVVLSAASSPAGPAWLGGAATSPIAVIAGVESSSAGAALSALAAGASSAVDGVLVEALGPATSPMAVVGAESSVEGDGDAPLSASDSREDGELEPIEPSQPSSSADESSEEDESSLVAGPPTSPMAVVGADVSSSLVSAAGVDVSLDGPPTSPMAVVGAAESLDESSLVSAAGADVSPPPSSLDSCEEGELEPIEPSQPLSESLSEADDDESLAAESDGPAASAASLGDDGDESLLPPLLAFDSCEDGELEPTEPSQPPPESSLPESDDESLGPAASAASLGDDGDESLLPLLLAFDSCEDGELEPTEPSQPPPESSLSASADDDEDSCDEGELEPMPPSQPPGSACATAAGMTEPAASAAATSAATERRRQ